jgi:3'(2'), 5'-bisphosphate nucleotidase
MLDLKTSEINFAIQAVRQASILVQQIQKELVSPTLTKDDRSPVTVADFTSQALIASLLLETFPGDPLVAEEDSKALRNPDAVETLEIVTRYVNLVLPNTLSQTICNLIDRGGSKPASRFWALDPIDGTKGFLRSDQYAVALALIVNGEVQLGVLGCPRLVDAHIPISDGPGSLLVAELNKGTWTTDLVSPGSYKRLKVSSQSNPVEARLLRSFETSHTNVSQIDEFSHALGIQAEPVCMDSQAKYAVLAAGKGELLLRLLAPAKPDYREKIWDQAAGSIILKEAGGWITDLDGNMLDFRTGRALVHNRGVLASNRILHESALRALRAISA